MSREEVVHAIAVIHEWCKSRIGTESCVKCSMAYNCCGNDYLPDSWEVEE